MSMELKSKLNNNARHLRFISRVEMFQRNRKQELDYLQFYSPPTRQIIQHSLKDPIPDPIPLLTPTTISFYRRTKSAVFKTRPAQDHNFDPHMIYESLWMLAGVEEKYYENYSTVIKEFERDLGLYLSSGSVDIRQLATIAAGNKIIGKEKDIVGLAEADPRQIWVLANHIYQKKISYKQLFSFLHAHHQVAYKTLYQLSNGRQDGIAQTIIAQQSVLQNLFTCLHSASMPIKKYAIRILGNVAAEKSQHVLVLHNLNVLDSLVELLETTIAQMRRDVCWLISNLICEKDAATKLVRHQPVISKLVQSFYCETTVNINRQLTQIFISLAHYAERKQAYQLLAHHKLLQICLRQLRMDENDLNNATLFLLNKLIELGDNCRNEDNCNLFCLMISAMIDLRSEISKKSYSQNNDISSLSLEILGHLEEEEDS